MQPNPPNMNRDGTLPGFGTLRPCQKDFAVHHTPFCVADKLDLSNPEWQQNPQLYFDKYRRKLEAGERFCWGCAREYRAEEEGLKRCTRCKTATYCGDDCRRKDWEAYHQTRCTKDGFKFPNRDWLETEEQYLHHRRQEHHVPNPNPNPRHQQQPPPVFSFSNSGLSEMAEIAPYIEGGDDRNSEKLLIIRLGSPLDLYMRTCENSLGKHGITLLPVTNTMRAKGMYPLLAWKVKAVHRLLYINIQRPITRDAVVLFRKRFITQSIVPMDEAAEADSALKKNDMVTVVMGSPMDAFIALAAPNVESKHQGFNVLMHRPTVRDFAEKRIMTYQIPKWKYDVMELFAALHPDPYGIWEKAFAPGGCDCPPGKKE